MKEEDKISQLEKDTACFRACEPGADSMAAIAICDDTPDDDDIATDEELDELDWSKFSSFGPFSEEEAIARIDEFEERERNGQVKWIRVDNIREELKKLHPWL